MDKRKGEFYNLRMSPQKRSQLIQEAAQREFYAALSPMQRIQIIKRFKNGDDLDHLAILYPISESTLAILFRQQETNDADL